MKSTSRESTLESCLINKGVVGAVALAALVAEEEVEVVAEAVVVAEGTNNINRAGRSKGDLVAVAAVAAAEEVVVAGISEEAVAVDEDRLVGSQLF